MGVILKYFLEFPEIGMTVSNNVYSGDYILDAEITATLLSGKDGGSFEIKLYDLPQKEFKKLDQLLTDKKSCAVKIELGYFEGPFEPVMEGRVNKLTVKVVEKQLVTTLKGLETGTFALANKKVKGVIAADTPLKDAVTTLLGYRENGGPLFPAGGEIDTTPGLQGLDDAKKLKAQTVHGKLLRVLDDLARQVGAELLVVDKKLWFGKPVRLDRGGGLPVAAPLELPRELVPDENLVSFEPFKKSLPEEITLYKLKPVPALEAQGFQFVVTGDPELRPAHKIAAALEGYDKVSGSEFRVSSLKHSYTLKGGYVVEGYALKVAADPDGRERQAAALLPTAAAIAAKLRGEAKPHPFVEVGKVKEYLPAPAAAPHRASLYFGQKAEKGETQPSVEVAVETDEEQVFVGKPLVSPFAWHKCGLVVPVYPGMKALLLHNQALCDDALVGGFLWSKTPAIEPPKNQPGDYWLCLPIEPPEAGPTSDTQAANDLTGKDGLRVIEAKGFTLRIGGGSLKSVGERPVPGNADELVIEHASGTSLTIDRSGKLIIKAPKGLEIEGNVEIK